ncbi:HD domain-containing protein [Lentzea sp. NPDC051213]|uniref:HD domain-containing protein n=1 Tax=Lentzea sp. NPDC051213 TaxID=3364126 RepID=UPI0037BAA788
MNNALALPTGALADASLALARQSVSVPLADHSIRSFLFARMIAEQEGSTHDAAYDEDLLFAACVLHDLALGPLGRGKSRFEVEGADLAVPVLKEHGVSSADIDRVWEAIALHSIIGIADRRGLLTYLTHKGTLTDAGRFKDVDDGRQRQVYAVYPRPADSAFILDAIVEHASLSEAAAPPHSIAAELLRQRQIAS